MLNTWVREQICAFPPLNNQPRAYVSYSCSNPIHRPVAYSLGFGKVHDIHVSAAGQSNLIRPPVTEAMIFQVCNPFLYEIDESETVVGVEAGIIL